MTKEEAIEILTNNWTTIDNSRYSSDELNEAFNMAIRALKNEQTDGDLISRKAVSDYARKMINNRTYPEERQILEDFIEWLDNLPSAEKTTINLGKTTITDGDLISKQDLLNATVNKNSIWNKITNSEGYNLEKIIENLPTYSLKEDTAEWDYSLWFRTCSNCQYTIANSDEEGTYISDKYCPYCGAKMKESEEEE